MPNFLEILIIVAIVALLFGSRKLPGAMGDLARGIKTFKAGLSGGRAAATAAEEPAPSPAAREILVLPAGGRAAASQKQDTAGRV